MVIKLELELMLELRFDSVEDSDVARMRRKSFLLCITFGLSCTAELKGIS